ncbi:MULTISPECIES: ABC transporter substrate-binding protein [unclassified Nocardioides]|uniref:ABC transporter substrate-binding protein n=1 Tax=unclassified Nocardioides TaxID=2615069 RepID=UPI000702E109|nr:MULTISPECIES: ABC transporter substrate-binding protein [unclassified Nocardioides]KQZ70395.1 hypothetical protein ASD66_12300 [Nocardioides sp. Root151]KRF18255.1 hypothetical protein ASH02_01440 [Nocardioides sp. Soil796]
MNRKTKLISLASAALLAASMSACGAVKDAAEKSIENKPAEGELRLGTTEVVTAMDPAGSYDFGSWNMQYSIFQQLMSIPPNGDQPEDDAAHCEAKDPKTVECKLKEGLKFSNGNELTSSDVLFSMKRNVEIADPNGSSVLLGSISNGDAKNPGLADGAIETPDDQTVVFHLNAADSTFLKVLTTATTSIVDEETFPADEKLADDKVIGSGPYTLDTYKKDELTVLAANKSYEGTKAPASKTIYITSYGTSANLKTAIENDKVDVAWRTLSPQELTDLGSNDKVDVITGSGSEFRYWVWQFGTKVGKDQAVRQAAAQIIDRDRISERAYDGTVEPAYSIVPPGFGGQKDSFEEKYGDPDPAAAKTILDEAGVKTPVKITVGWNPDHYGPNTVDEAQELEKQLEADGLFDVTLQSDPWEEYQTLYKQNAYDLFILGWYPDILDADNYLTPFLRDGGFFANNYQSDEVNDLLSQELAETDEGARDDIIGQLQDVTAEDVPLIPSWNGKNVAVAKKGVTGVKETLDPTYIFRLWMVKAPGDESSEASESPSASE